MSSFAQQLLLTSHLLLNSLDKLFYSSWNKQKGKNRSTLKSVSGHIYILCLAQQCFCRNVIEGSHWLCAFGPDWQRYHSVWKTIWKLLHHSSTRPLLKWHMIKTTTKLCRTFSNSTVKSKGPELIAAAAPCVTALVSKGEISRRLVTVKSSLGTSADPSAGTRAHVRRLRLRLQPAKEDVRIAATVDG